MGVPMYQVNHVGSSVESSVTPKIQGDRELRDSGSNSVKIVLHVETCYYLKSLNYLRK